ncbi:MAG: ROK family protein [Pseudonocardiales bacterium]|nr:ROK family protein [Pseudonocardiales bacterium]
MSYLGIDIGGSKVAFRVESDGEKSYEKFFRWPQRDSLQPENVTRDLDTLQQNLRELRNHWRDIEAVGIAMPATLNGAGQIIAWPGRPGWVGLDLQATLRTLFPDVGVRCADDGDLAAMAEAREADCADLLYVGVGTGIGGGIVLGGQPCPGLARGSCEIGHIVIDRFGLLCDCGRRGCVQAIASGPVTLHRAAELHGRDVTFDELRQALAAGASWAVSAIEESCGALAVAVISVGELLHPTLVLIGGGFASAMPGFVATVAKHVVRLARPGHPPVPIRPAVLGGLSSLHGAILAARSIFD